MVRSRRLVLVLIVLALGACSGGDGEVDAASPEGILTAAPGRTIAAGSSKIAVKAAVDGQTRGTFDGAGEFEFETERGRLDLDLGPLGLAGAGRTEVLLDRDNVYLKLGRQLPGLGNKPWLKIDLDALAGGQGDSIEALRQLQANDPSAVLNYLRGVTGKTTKVGVETVRGAVTTHYKATVDLRKAAESSPKEVQDDLTEVVRQLGDSRLPVEAWIDGDGRLRRLRYRVDLAELADDAPAKGAGKGTVTANLELFDFGVAVTITPPPEGETTDLARLLGRTGE